jgi:hypothetical protein
MGNICSDVLDAKLQPTSPTLQEWWLKTKRFAVAWYWISVWWWCSWTTSVCLTLLPCPYNVNVSAHSYGSLTLMISVSPPCRRWSHERWKWKLLLCIALLILNRLNFQLTSRPYVCIMICANMSYSIGCNSYFLLSRGIVGFFRDCNMSCISAGLLLICASHKL